MKATLEIPDALYRQAREHATHSGQSVVEFILELVREHVEKNHPPAERSDQNFQELYGLGANGFLVLKRPAGDRTCVTNDFVNQMREELGV